MEKYLKKRKGGRREPVLSLDVRAQAGAIAPGDVVIYQEGDRKVKLMLVEQRRAGKVSLRRLQQRVLAPQVSIEKGMKAMVTGKGRRFAVKVVSSPARTPSGPALALQGHEVFGPTGPGLVGLGKSRGSAGPGSGRAKEK